MDSIDNILMRAEYYAWHIAYFALKVLQWLIGVFCVVIPATIATFVSLLIITAVYNPIDDNAQIGLLISVWVVMTGLTFCLIHTESGRRAVPVIGSFLAGATKGIFALLWFVFLIIFRIGIVCWVFYAFGPIVGLLALILYVLLCISARLSTN